MLDIDNQTIHDWIVTGNVEFQIQKDRQQDAELEAQRKTDQAKRGL